MFPHPSLPVYLSDVVSADYRVPAVPTTAVRPDTGPSQRLVWGVFTGMETYGRTGLGACNMFHIHP